MNEVYNGVYIIDYRCINVYRCIACMCMEVNQKERYVDRRSEASSCAKG